MEPAWLAWARRLSALAQTGLTFAENPYDIERYTAIRTIAAEMMPRGMGADAGCLTGRATAPTPRRRSSPWPTSSLAPTRSRSIRSHES